MYANIRQLISTTGGRFPRARLQTPRKKPLPVGSSDTCFPRDVQDVLVSAAPQRPSMGRVSAVPGRGVSSRPGVATFHSYQLDSSPQFTNN